MSAVCSPASTKQTRPAPSRPAGLWIETADRLDDVAPHLAAWDDLLEETIEPNAFYEPWQLLPALELFAANDPWKLVFVYRAHKRADQPNELLGVFPLVRTRLGRWPIHVWRLWYHDYSFCCTPPLRKDAGVETLISLGQWIADPANGAPLWDVRHVAMDGGFGHAFVEASRKAAWLVHPLDAYARAMLRPAETSDIYIESAVTTHHRQEIRRQRRRLSERGELELRVSSPQEDLSTWTEQFLEMEAAGWKGREGTALTSRADHREYFQRLVSAGGPGRVSFLGLFQGETPIALKCNFLAPPGSFAFKIAFDESLAKFSPGVQLEIENIHWLHGRRDLQWMDSCAARDHFMINRLWKDQRSIKRLLVSPGRRTGDLMLGVLQFSQAVRSAVSRRSVPQTSST